MKFHLPKKLFAAILATMACSAYAIGPMHAQVRQIVAEGKTTNATTLLKFSNNGPWPGTSNEVPQVWVKDGLGTATVTEDLTLYNPLVVREGTMSMSDCTIKNYTPLSNGVSNLSVGGIDAHLILDGATYKQDLDYNQNYTSAIAIGTGDGSGKLTLLNGSLLHTDHFIFAGVKHATYAGQPAYVVQTTKSQDDDTLYESQHTDGSVQRSEINIEGGSVLSAGTCLQFADVDVNIKGEGSELTDLNRDSSPASANYSYFAYSQDAETNINITEGAKVNLKQHLMTGSGADSKTSIKADGNGSSFNLLGYAYMGYGAYDYEISDYVSCGATTTLSLSNGASSSFGGLVIGYNDNTSINVDAASTLEVTDEFYAYQSSDITNAGTISAGTFYTSGKMTLSMGSSLSVASLQIDSGASITVDARNGSAAPITVSGAMDLSTGATVILNFTDAYLSSLETDSSWDGSVKVAFAEVDGSKVTGSNAGLAWSENFFWELDEQLAWVVEDTSTYICAKLSRKTEIDLAGQEEIDATIADTATGAAVSVTAKHQDVTLSGDNTYSGSTTLDNAKLTLGSESALGTSTVKTSGTSAIATAEGITAKLSNTIENSGGLTLDGSYDASQMELTEYEATRVDTEGNTGSDGFHRNAGSTIQVVDNAEESSLTLGDNFSIAIGTKEYELDAETGTATYDMEIDYSSYTVASADHNVAVSEIQAASSDQTTKVEMSDGALTADADMEVATTGGELTVAGATVSGSIADTTIISEGGQITATVSGESYIAVNAETTISGENTSTAGMQVNNTALTLGSATALGAGTVNAVDTSTITTAEGVTADLSSAILNSGTLTLDGSYDASALEVTAIDATRVDITGNEGDNGFQRDAGSSVVVVENCGEEASITLGENLSVSIGTKEYELDAVTGIATADAGTDYSTYYIAKAEHSVAVSEIQAVSADQTTKVEMSDGALTADADMEVATTGGELTVAGATVSGSIADTDITSEGGEIAAAVSGESYIAVNAETTISGENTSTAGMQVNNTALTLGSASALGAGTVNAVETSTITTAEGITATLSSAILNSGTLTLDGSYDASALEVTAIDATRVDIAGNEGDNGFQRDAGSSVVVVENCGEESSITLGENLSVSIGTKEYELDAVTGIATADAGTNYSTYYVAAAEHSVSVSEIQAVSADQTTKVEMSDGALTADADMEVATTGGELTVQNAKVSGSIADTAITSEGGEISADISGKSSVAVTGKTTLSGNNSYTGNTTIDGAELIVTRENALGTGEVIMKNHAILDLQGMNISNRITVYGCTLAGASSYTGNLVVDSGELTLRDATKADTVEVSNGATLTGADLTANTVTVTDNGAINDVAVTAGSVTVSSGGSISGATLTARQVTVNSEANKESKITSAVTITDNGTLTVNGDQNLDVTGSLTLGSGSTVKLNGEGKVNVAGKVTIKKGASIITSGEFEVGDELISSETPIEVEEGVKFTFGTLEVELQKGETTLVIVSMFKQELADAYTLSNWGMVTASRAVVNAVRGQRSNTGCIANGRGTAWAAVLGGNHDINGGDINLKGAAVGADMKVGSRSKLGLALGYTEADIKPDGIAASDSTGTYIAAYGEHLIKKLSPTSCLSLDWVASYGQTESERNSLDWEQQSLQFNTRLSWNKQIKERLCISVFGGLEYYTNESDTVEGVKTGSIQNLRGEIGVGARYVAWGSPTISDGKMGLVQPGCEKLVLHGEVRYMNDMVRSNPVVRMNGLSGMGENPGRQGVGIEAGATYRIGERWSASANYGFNTMEDSKEHRVNVGASYTF